MNIKHTHFWYMFLGDDCLFTSYVETHQTTRKLGVLSLLKERIQAGIYKTSGVNSSNKERETYMLKHVESNENYVGTNKSKGLLQ